MCVLQLSPIVYRLSDRMGPAFGAKEGAMHLAASHCGPIRRCGRVDGKSTSGPALTQQGQWDRLSPPHRPPRQARRSKSRVVGDRGYTSHAFRDHIWSIGARPAIPHQRHEAPVARPEWITTNRNQVARWSARLKEWRAVATRYEKTATSFASVLFLAAALDWSK